MATDQKKLRKAELIRSFKELPESATVEDFAEHLAYILGIEQGLADAEAGRVIPHEELLERIRSWGTEEGANEGIKRKVVQSLARLPDDATAEDIEYRVYVVLKIERALAESAAGNKVSHEEARERLKHWLE